MEKPYSFPVALSQISDGEDSRDPQDERAIRWLTDQPGGKLTLVTPRKQLGSPVLAKWVKHPQLRHVSWRGLNARGLTGRVLLAYPSQEILNRFWHARLDALCVIEWEPVPDWIEDASPILLTSGGASMPMQSTQNVVDLPAEIDAILEHLAAWASGYSSGLQWDEENKLKADLMNRPSRWAGVSPQSVKQRCRGLGMSPDDVETITDLVTRASQGKRLRPARGYKDFHFPD